MIAFGEVSDALIGYEKLHEVRLRRQDTVSDLEEMVRIPSFAIKVERPISRFWTGNDHSTPPS